jgi:hypothetical protein
LKALLVSLFISLSSLSIAHPFYVSVLEMRFNPLNHSLECALKIFTDDLENALEHSLGAKKLYLSETREHPEADSLIWRYIQQRLKMNALPMTYVGREGDIDAQWMYFEIALPKNTENIELKWSTLIEVLPGQKNILHWKGVGKQRMYIFDKKNLLHILSLRS